MDSYITWPYQIADPHCRITWVYNKFVEQTKEIMYQKWKTAFLADLIWTCGQHVLFRNIFVCFCLHCACAQIIIILTFSLLTNLYVKYFRFQILVSMLSIINHNIEHEFFEFFIPNRVGVSL